MSSLNLIRKVESILDGASTVVRFSKNELMPNPATSGGPNLGTSRRTNPGTSGGPNLGTSRRTNPGTSGEPNLGNRTVESDATRNTGGGIPRRAQDWEAILDQSPLLNDNPRKSQLIAEVLKLTKAAEKINQKYIEIGAERSPLGLQTFSGDAVAKDGQEYFLDYLGGKITVSPDGTVNATGTYRTTAIYKGIHCFGKSESTDEPYAVCGAYALRALDRTVTKKFPIGSDSYENFVRSTQATDATVFTPEDVTWSPQTLVIVSTVMEHDSGDPERVAADVTEKIKSAADQAGYGEQVSVFTGILETLGIPDLIAALLGVGDDHIGTVIDVIHDYQLEEGLPMRNFQNINYNVESGLISDGDASYKLFYEVYKELIIPPIRLGRQ